MAQSDPAQSTSRFVHIDLTGSKLGVNFLSVEVELRNPGAFADRIRAGAAEYYGVPIEQVGPLTDPNGGHLMEAEAWTWGLGPMGEAGVGLACQECRFQTNDERKADAHNALTGHAIAIDYVDHESEWPAL